MNQEVFAALGEAMKRAEDVALVTIVATNGSTPQRVGAKMLVYADGRTVGTIGGGCYENDAFWKARTALETRKPARVKYELDDDFAQENGLVCGGQMEVFIEPIEPPPAVYIIGAGHVGFYLARFAHEAGFQVHVVDDREAFANRERFPDATDVVVDDVPGWLAGASLPASAYVVIVTRGHRHDLDALRAVVDRDLRYVGLIGSRAKVARIYDALVADGVAPERLAHVHAPIGLDLGAVTPQEIAVSITAELIAVRRGRTADPAVAAASLKWMPRLQRTPTPTP
jgi:xanthine dehydrogenase accessory factor